MTRFIRTTVAIASALALLLSTSGALRAAAPSAVKDVGPNAPWADPYGFPMPVSGFSGPWGGRVNALAIDPVNADVVYAAGEFSGLWRTVDRGLHWSHVDSTPLMFGWDVEIAPSDPSLIIATGIYDGRTDEVPPIWRSTDGGTTWSRPVPAGCPEPSSYGAAIAPGTPGSLKVFVGGSCGLWYSPDSGASWALFSPGLQRVLPNGDIDNTIWDVQVRPTDGGALQVDVCGEGGYARSTTGGGTAASYTVGANPLDDDDARGPCTVATAPQDPDIVYTTNFRGGDACNPQAKQSTDGGNSWTSLFLTDKNCRPPFVVTHPALDGDPGHFETYVGTSVRLLHQHCDAAAAAPCAPGGEANWPDEANWDLAAFDDNHAHGDPTDIVFDPSTPNGCPLLTSNDGGVFRTVVDPPFCPWIYDWADANIGLHGLEIRQLAGTVYPGTSPPQTDLYFGTQDTGLYYTPDRGKSYTQHHIADVERVLADHNSPARVFWDASGSLRIASAGIIGATAFPPVPGDDVGATVFRNHAVTGFGATNYAFVTRDASPNEDHWKVEVTTNEGVDWSQMGPDPLPGYPQGYGGFAPTIAASGPSVTPTFYLLLQVGTERAIYRLTGPFSSAATLTLANNGLMNPTTFAVDPNDPLRLYAYDQLSGGVGKVMRSTDGGASWTADDELTTMITRGNLFKTMSHLGPAVWSIAFDANSDTIMVGTLASGIFASPDKGEHWFSVRGSEVIPRVSGFFFDEGANVVYAGSAGRGLWEIELPSADLGVVKTDSPDPIFAGEDLTYTITVANAGPDTASAITVTDTLPAQVDFVSSTIPCTVADNILTCPVDDLSSGSSTSFGVTVTVHPDTAVSGPTTIHNQVAVSSTEAIDADLSNNSDDEGTLVKAKADLAIVSFDAVAPPPEVLIGEGVDVTLRKVITNHGPSSPMDVLVTRTAIPPAGSSVIPTTASAITAAVAKDEMRTIDEIFTITCAVPGQQTFAFGNTIAPASADDLDPDLSNNTASTTVSVECVVPVAINIQPGGFPNGLNLKGSATVAVLTTNAGEYGLPLAFDATTIDPVSVRFGPPPVVFAGTGGALETHLTGHLEDSRELDEKTRDGDLDMLLHFRVADSGLSLTSTEGCVKGIFTDGGGATYKFFGCDSVKVSP